jgi:hypothetical protein
MTTATEINVYRNRGPEPLSTHTVDGLCVYQPGDVIPEDVIRADLVPGHEWTSIAGALKNGFVRLEPLNLPEPVEIDEVDGIVRELTEAARKRSRAKRNLGKTEGAVAAADLGVSTSRHNPENIPSLDGVDADAE